MRTNLAAFAGVAALAASTGVLLAATSASAIRCPHPTHHAYLNVAGRQVGVCTVGPVPPGCDPGPCDPTAVAPNR